MKIMKSDEMKKVVNKVKDVRSKIVTKINDQSWIDDARKYAEKQKAEVRKVINAENIAKVKSFVDKEKRELERLHKQIPSEIKKLRSFVQSQRKEVEKLLRRVKAGKGFRKTKKKSSA